MSTNFFISSRWEYTIMSLDLLVYIIFSNCFCFILTAIFSQCCSLALHMLAWWPLHDSWECCVHWFLLWPIQLASVCYHPLLPLPNPIAHPPVFCFDAILRWMTPVPSFLCCCCSFCSWYFQHAHPFLLVLSFLIFQPFILCLLRNSWMDVPVCGWMWLSDFNYLTSFLTFQSCMPPVCKHR